MRNTRFWWRRRPAGGFGFLHTLQNRRRDAGVTREHLSVVLQFWNFELLGRHSTKFLWISPPTRSRQPKLARRCGCKTILPGAHFIYEHIRPDLHWRWAYRAGLRH